MGLSNEELAAAAGINPWELRDDLAEGNPAEIIGLAQQFHKASGQAADAADIAGRADRITAAGYQLDNTPVHDVNTHLEQTRAQLGNRGEDLARIARNLSIVADDLGFSTTRARDEVATLDSELERVRTAIDQVIQDASLYPITTRNYNQEAEELRAAAVDKVRTTGGHVRLLVDRYEEILTRQLKELGDLGYHPPDEIDTGDRAIPATGTNPLRVNDWWESLTPHQQQELITEHPREIGNLDGIPAVDRDKANRSLLTSEIAQLDAQIAEFKGRDTEGPMMKSAISALEARRGALGALEKRLDLHEIEDGLRADADKGKPQAYLLGFDPAGDGKAIVAVGNPDTARNVVTYVPGTDAALNGVAGDIERADVTAKAANARDPGSPTSSILWLGYDAPNGLPDAINRSYAEQAAPALDSFQDGLRFTHGGGVPSHNTVLGHSYGSTVVGYAAKGYGLNADDVVFVGSPGVGADNPSELGFNGDHVWSSHAENDPIVHAIDPTPRVGSPFVTDPLEPKLIHGANPSDPDFGGRTFQSDPSGDGEKGHSQYWNPHSKSLENMTDIITGQYGEVNR